MAGLRTELEGVALRNPLIPAAGILGETGRSLPRVTEAGAGAVTTKSIGIEPRTGHQNPTSVDLEHGILSALGLPNPGIKKYVHELKHVVGLGVPMIGSVFGKNAEEFAFIGCCIAEHGVAALGLNLSCPHSKSCGMFVGSDTLLVREIVAAVKAVVRVPVFAKLTPNTGDPQCTVS